MTLTAPQTARKTAIDKPAPTTRECEEAERQRKQWERSQTEANQPRLSLD